MQVTKQFFYEIIESERFEIWSYVWCEEKEHLKIEYAKAQLSSKNLKMEDELESEV